MNLTINKAVGQVLENLERRDRSAQYKEDPVLWVQDMLGGYMWSKQREIALSLVTNKDNVVKAGHGVGKSWLAAVLIAWWIDTRPNGFVASTAPSTYQIGGVVWRELRAIKRLIEQRYKEGLVDHKLPGDITSLNIWKTDDGQILGWGRKPPDEKVDDAFQGIHAVDGVLAIGDEAVGLTEEMIDALGNITSNANSRRLLICNPTNPASYVGKLFKEKPKNWTYHTISVFDSPNFTGEEVPEELREALTDQSYVDAKREEYGEGTPRWISRVLGEFAFDVPNSLITDRELSVGYDTEIVPSSDTRPVLGVDVARFGDDKSVVYSNHDGYLRLLDSWDHTPGTETAARINRAALDAGAREVRIDGAGIGGPIIDQVVGLSQGRYRIIEMLGNKASPDKFQWYNIRAWWYDGFRQALYDGRVDLDPKDDTLVSELMNIQYKFAPNGGLLIESKDEMKKRGIKSPDFADAAIYAVMDTNIFSNGDALPGDVIYFDGEMAEDARMWSAL